MIRVIPTIVLEGQNMRLLSTFLQHYLNWVDKHIVTIAYVGLPLVIALTLLLNY